MSPKLLGIVGLIFLFGGIVSTVCMIYYSCVMHAGARTKSKMLLALLGPFKLFIPQLWDEPGSRARIKFIFSAIAFAICFAALMLITK